MQLERFGKSRASLSLREKESVAWGRNWGVYKYLSSLRPEGLEYISNRG